MLRFFIGTLIAQLGTVLLTATMLRQLTLNNLLITLFPIVLISIVTSLWFSTVARQMAERRIAAERETFARERENLNVDAERAKTRLVRQTQKQIASETRKTRNRANFKVGAAVTVAAGFGLIMLFTSMVTLGLLTLTTAGGAIGGYLARARRDPLPLPNDDIKLIELGADSPAPESDEVDRSAARSPASAEGAGPDTGSVSGDGPDQPPSNNSASQASASG